MEADVMTERVERVALLGALAWATLLNGAVVPDVWAVAAIGVAVAACASVRLSAERPLPSPGGWAKAGVAWWVFLIVAGALQLIPLPVAWVALLSPARAALAAETDAVTALARPDGPGPSPPAVPLTVNSEATALAVAELTTLAALYVVAAFRSGRSRLFASSFSLLIGIAVAQSALLLVQYSARLSGSWRDLPFGLYSGTYYNRNGFGNLLALSVPVTGALLLSRLLEGREEDGGRGDRLPARLWDAGRRGALWLGLALALQWGALLLCRSRGAWIAGNAALGVLVLAAVFRARASARLAAACAVPLLIALGIGGLLGIDEVLARWEGGVLESDFSLRREWWTAAWRAFMDHPLTGAGLGAFGDFNGAYRDPTVASKFVLRAHNDYLEALADLGAAGGAAAIAALGFGAALMLRACRRGDVTAMGAGAALFAFAVHAAVDFPIGFPANAMWAAVLGGALTATAGRGGGAEGAETAGGGVPDPGFPPRRRLGGWALAAAPFAAAVPAVVAAVANDEIDPARPACRRIRETGRVDIGTLERDPGELPIGALLQRADAASRRFFGAGEACRLMGTLQWYRTQHPNDDGGQPLSPEQSLHALRRSIVSYGESLRRRPAVGEAYMEYAWVLLRAARWKVLPAAEARAAAERAAATAVRLSPWNPRVQFHDADLRLQRARDAATGPAEAAAAREASKASYRRLFSLSGVPQPAFFLHHAWDSSGSAEFMLDCIPPDQGDRTDVYHRQAAQILAATGHYEDSDMVIEAWRRWRVGEAERALAAGDAARAVAVGGVFAAPKEGVPAEIPAVLKEARRRIGGGEGEKGGGGEGESEGVSVLEQTLKPGTDVQSTFTAGGIVVFRVEGTTFYEKPPPRGPHWTFNPCLLFEAEIDGALAVQTFLPLEGGRMPAPYQCLLRLDPGVHRLTVRCRSLEDVMGNSPSSGRQRSRLSRVSVLPGE
jgi:O-antigen ligase